MEKDNCLPDKEIPNNSQEDKSSERVDIANFVVEVERFSKLTEPLAFVLYAFGDVREWTYPAISLGLWIISNVFCCFLSKGAVFVFVSLLVILIGTACLLQLHTRILDKFLPITQKEDSYADINADDATNLNTVREFRYSLIQMYDFIVKCNDHLAQFYGILRWDNTWSSLRFHIELCFLLLSFVVLPTRWICFVIINWFFLATENVLKVLYGYGQRVLDPSGSKESLDSQGKSQVNQDSQDKLGKSCDEEAEGSLDAVEKDDFSDTECDVGQMDEAGDSELKSQSKPGMVARLLDMKRRRQHLAAESCFACKVSFSSILKRRYYCRHCGNHFCAKCCNQKVPRSVFGATAPAALKETVLVCTVCYELLSKKDGKEKSS
ncbi:hypothetical protein ScPMuIL_005274 [Solemya velum]